LIHVNAVAFDRTRKLHMARSTDLAERLLAQASLYRHIAEECGDEELAAAFRRGAGECIADASRSKGNGFFDPRAR